MENHQHKFPDIFPGGMYLQSPNLSQFNDHQSASAGSTESFQTQVPLPYYLQSNSEQQRPYAVPTNLSPWATPDLNSSPVLGSFQSSTKALNPASSPYVPPSHLSQSPGMAHNFQAQFEHANGYSQGNSFSSASSMMQPFQQGSQIGQIGHMLSYKNVHQYPPQPNMHGGPVGGGFPPHFQQAQYGAGPSYGQYAPPPIAQFPAYNSGFHMNNANPPAQFAPMFPHTNTGQNIHGMQYHSGVIPSGASQPWAANFSGPNMHHSQGMGPVGAPYTGYGQGTGFGTSSTMPYNSQSQNSSFVNTRQSSSASIHSKQSTLSGGQAPHYGGQDAANNFERRGSIHTPLANATQLAQSLSPETTVKKAPSHSMGRNVHNLDNDDTKSSLNLAPTPSSRAHQLDMDFSSEPRKLEAPPTRSRRGYTVSTADPAHKSAVFDWLQNTPGLESTSLQDSLSDSRRRISPPKMMSLLNAGSGTASSLKTINEDDPFVYGPSDLKGKGRAIDPFASMQAVVPYSNNSLGLVGQKSSMSPQLNLITSNGTRKPTFAEAVDPKNLPFAEICRLAKEDCWGVVKIKNIPYSVNRPEVLAFLGRNAKIVAEYDNEPIHIIMERVTSKTLDCYVEFVSFNEAVAAVNRFETNRTGGRSGRLGQRHVEVELSSQEHLMKDLFPKAKNVKWNGSKPTIISTNGNDAFNSGFQGFISREELVMLVKHVESPQRSPFSKDCPQRPFECLISTLIKYPWQMVEYITIEERNMLHKATIDLLSLLVERVNNDKDDMCLTPMLLKRVWKAALKCPGFTPTMKDDIVFICQIDNRTAAEYGVAPYAPYWKYLWTIGPKPGAPVDLLLWYVAIIRETTKKRQLSLAEQAAMGQNSDEVKLFGDLDKHLNFPKHLHHMTLAEVARIEWSVIEKLLRQALG